MHSYTSAPVNETHLVSDIPEQTADCDVACLFRGMAEAIAVSVETAAPGLAVVGIGILVLLIFIGNGRKRKREEDDDPMPGMNKRHQPTTAGPSQPSDGVREVSSESAEAIGLHRNSAAIAVELGEQQGGNRAEPPVLPFGHSGDPCLGLGEAPNFTNAPSLANAADSHYAPNPTYGPSDDYAPNSTYSPSLRYTPNPTYSPSLDYAAGSTYAGGSVYTPNSTCGPSHDYASSIDAAGYTHAPSPTYGRFDNYAPNSTYAPSSASWSGGPTPGGNQEWAMMPVGGSVPASLNSVYSSSLDCEAGSAYSNASVYALNSAHGASHGHAPSVDYPACPTYGRFDNYAPNSTYAPSSASWSGDCPAPVGNQEWEMRPVGGSLPTGRNSAWSIRGVPDYNAAQTGVYLHTPALCGPHSSIWPADNTRNSAAYTGLYGNQSSLNACDAGSVGDAQFGIGGQVMQSGTVHPAHHIAACSVPGYYDYYSTWPRGAPTPSTAYTTYYGTQSMLSSADATTSTVAMNAVQYGTGGLGMPAHSSHPTPTSGSSQASRGVVLRPPPSYETAVKKLIAEGRYCNTATQPSSASMAGHSTQQRH